MTSKIGRNAPCWCGSGKKYKYCHMTRHHEEPVAYQDILTEWRRALGKKSCLHPLAGSHTCQPSIVEAHTIQRNGGLSRIARDGQVYGFLTNDPMPLIKSGESKARLVGLRNASTFPGFCAYHDTKTFAPIETKPFQPTAEQAFLLGYRSICRELYTKRAAMSVVVPFLRTMDRGRNLQDQVFIQGSVEKFSAGTMSGLKNIEHHKTLYDKDLVEQNFSGVRYYIVRLDCVPDIMCSGALFPEIDFCGNHLQDILADEPALLSFSIIATDYGGAVMFGWLHDSEVGTRFIRSLDSLSDEEIPHAIVRFTFEFFENAYFSPNWWERLAQEERDCIQNRINLATDVQLPRKSDCLRDDGARVVNWKVRERITNLLLQ